MQNRIINNFLPKRTKRVTENDLKNNTNQKIPHDVIKKTSKASISTRSFNGDKSNITTSVREIRNPNESIAIFTKTSNDLLTSNHKREMLQYTHPENPKFDRNQLKSRNEEPEKQKQKYDTSFPDSFAFAK